MKATVLCGLVPGVLLALWSPAAASERRQPLPVSPGSAGDAVLITDPCPTFSWSQGVGAGGYELVVYRLREDGEEAEPLIRQKVPGPAGSWTPPLAACLERGARYAWSLRATGQRPATAWSPPAFFEVVAGPTEEELEAALEVVRRYLAVRDAAPAPSRQGPTTKSTPPPPPQRSLGPSPPLVAANANGFPPFMLSLEGGSTGHGVYIETSVSDGIFVQKAGNAFASGGFIGNHHGLEVWASEHAGVMVNQAGQEGLWVYHAMEEGIEISFAETVGVEVSCPGAAPVPDDLAASCVGDAFLANYGYFNLASTGGEPAAAHCDNSAEYGRMIMNPDNGVLYLCASGGWAAFVPD